jgi:Domain of unknown function (DUF4440)
MRKTVVLAVLCLCAIAHWQAPNSIAQGMSNSTRGDESSVPKLSSEQKDVWEGEQNYFRYMQSRNLNAFLSLWDDNFIGWPDYSVHPLRKADIESGVAEEFKREQTNKRPMPTPKPEAIGMFGDVAVTHYFWPESDETSPFKYRVTHTWQKGPEGWRIIGGMACEVPRFTASPLDDKHAVEMTIRSSKWRCRSTISPRQILFMHLTRNGSKVPNTPTRSWPTLAGRDRSGLGPRQIRFTSCKSCTTSISIFAVTLHG